jgi:hypothetical protein
MNRIIWISVCAVLMSATAAGIVLRPAPPPTPSPTSPPPEPTLSPKPVSTPPGPSGQVPLTPGNWNIRYSPGMPVNPGAAPSGGWVFSFPLAAPGVCPAPPTTGPNFNVSTCPHVDYVTATYITPIVGSSLSMTFSIAVGPNTGFDYHTAANNTCVNPANFRFLIERTDDAGLYQPYYRWWSHDISYQLQPIDGSLTLTVPLTPDRWSSALGEIGNASAAATAGFADTLNNVGLIGITFGGGCFAGHGVYLNSGTATFTVTDFRINP